ncbi:hypothetical protein [Dietzia psychralcaliphila]|uniref:hypothetical protein n=1 Tax=Dietzia psychralcaliphila TaxID=139021 RepID=UPI000D2F793B|nr:hypothetical protein [Dietzia psychralcaliphila]PTM85351.1 hypothetical protein C8N39_11294 [Dietzia psychralcaliphila]
MSEQSTAELATTGGETIFVFISDENGGTRIKNGEPELDVIRGTWVCSPERAKRVDHLVAVGADGLVTHAMRASVGNVEQVKLTKKTVSRVLFDVEDAPEMEFLVGHPSPVAQVRNPVAYESTQWVLHGDATLVDSDADDATRAVVRGYVLDVDENGDAYVTAPEGGSVTVLCR